MERFDTNAILNWEQAILFVVVFVVCAIGAYSKDVLDTFTKKNEKIQTKIILLSSLLVSIIIWSFAESIIGKVGIKPFFSVILILGMVSYEISIKLTSISGIKQLLRDFRDFKEYVSRKK